MDAYRYDPYNGDTLPDNDTELYLGEMRQLRGYETPLPTDLLAIPYTWGSDYSGDSVTVSNYRSLWRDYHSAIPTLYRVEGNYSTYGLVITRAGLDSPEAADLRAAIEHLDLYPLYDEDDLSEVELEAIEASWEMCYRRDYARLLERYGVIPDDSDIPDVVLRQTLQRVEDRHNLEWINETGNSAYIDIERAASLTTAEDVSMARVEVASWTR